MEMGKEDLGLSLSLSFPGEISSRVATTSGTTTDASRRPMMMMQLNLMPSSVQPCASSSSSAAYRKNPRTEAFASSDRSSGDVRSFLRGIDVNRAPPSTAECEEEAGVSSPNSTISSVSGKRSEGDANCEDRDAERASSRGISDEEEGENSRKKLRLTKDQSSILEESFKEHHTLNPKQKVALAKRLNLRARQVEVWFQNRRARTKLKQTEVDCEFLKRCCENLTEENRRLHKEVMELRALKLSPQFYMKMAPPTTLTMCPSCERVSGPPPSAQPHAQPIGPAQHRPIPVNPWGPAASVSRHPSTALHLRS